MQLVGGLLLVDAILVLVASVCFGPVELSFIFGPFSSLALAVIMTLAQHRSSLVFMRMKHFFAFSLSIHVPDQQSISVCQHPDQREVLRERVR
mgnify:CR=1 FL=1